MRKYLLLILILIPSLGQSEYVFENFDTHMGGFIPLFPHQWLVKNGHLYSDSSVSEKESIYFLPWIGDSLLPTNYFYNFIVSVEVNYETGNEDALYGLELGIYHEQSLNFSLTKRGEYFISSSNAKNDKYWAWNTSPLINGKNDILTVVKQGDLWRFFINWNEIEFFKIKEALGGGIALFTSSEVHTSFDNFEIVDLSDEHAVASLGNQDTLLTIPILQVKKTKDILQKYRSVFEVKKLEDSLHFEFFPLSMTAPDELNSWFDVFGKIAVDHYPSTFDISNDQLDLPLLAVYDAQADLPLFYSTQWQIDHSKQPAQLILKEIKEFSPSCQLLDENKWLLNRMKDVYLWYDKIPEIDYKAYASPEELLEAIRFKELDLWSLIAPQQEFDNLLEKGQYEGLGFALQYDDEGRLRVSLVFKNSPAERAHIKRGDILLRVDGKNMTEVTTEQVLESLEQEKINLTFQEQTGHVVEVSLPKETITTASVYYSDILERGQVGYLVFNNFIASAYEELDKIFTTFKQAGIKELILDLRYNGGGEGEVARYLASLIVNESTKGQIFLKSIGNDKHPEYTYQYLFENLDQSLHLKRLFVITSLDTCSASEALINGLRPFMEVIVIGSPTCGKPVGMVPQYFCDQVLVPITLQAMNAQQQGDYFQGITPICSAYDGLTMALGNMEEPSLKEALFYLQNNHCSQEASTRSKLPPYKLNLKGFRREIGSF